MRLPHAVAPLGPLLAPLLAPLLVLAAACGADPDAAPDPAQSSTSATAAPSGAQAEVVSTAAELLQRVGGAMARARTVHVSVGAGGEPPVLEADARFIGSTDVSAVLRLGDRDAEMRRVGDQVYLRQRAKAPWERRSVADLRRDGGMVGGFAARWDLVGDLRDLLVNARGFDVATFGPLDVSGIPVTSYEFRVPAAAAIPSALVPDTVTGEVAVVLSVGVSGLPVRMEETYGRTMLRTTYGGWGGVVDVEPPATS